MKTWVVQPNPPAEFLAEHPELPPIVARLLWNRGIREQTQIDEFLNPDYVEDIHDPYLFNDMGRAVDIIFTAIGEQKNIVVHGDYDADGVCAATLIISCLKKLGAQHVNVFIPHREIDGYGLNVNTVQLLHSQKTDLIITCDCGVSNVEEIKLAKKLGMTVIVTDHHATAPCLPTADAIIHPKVKGEKYPDKGLAGGAVAFKLVQGLLKKHRETCAALPDGQAHEGYEKWQLDLAAIATIGDMVPLLGESRTLARYGLTVLNKTRNLGLQKLLMVAGAGDADGQPKRGAYDAHTVGFQIVPRLNAAGRMDHANSAFALLMATESAEAERLAEQLNKNNTDRQKLTEQLVNQARAYIKETGQDKNHVLYAFNPDWPTGVLGLVAGKLKDEYNKPAFAFGQAGEEIVGSGRSIDEFNLIEGLQSMPEYFIKFGGHPQACGASIATMEKFEAFKTALSKRAQEQLARVDISPTLTLDAEVDLDEVNWKLYDILQKFEPFGQNNEEPKYAARDLTVLAVEPVGQDGRHLRIMVKHNSATVRKTIAFGFGDSNRHSENWRETLKNGDKIDLAFTVGVNEWNGNRELQLTVEDMKRTKNL